MQKCHFGALHGTESNSRFFWTKYRLVLNLNQIHYTVTRHRHRARVVCLIHYFLSVIHDYLTSKGTAEVEE